MSGGREALLRQIRDLGPWFHNLELNGVATAPDHFLGDYPRRNWLRWGHIIEPDLRGRTVLDIGCNAGFFALEVKRRGADRVVGIDSDPRYLAQARFASEVTGLDIEIRQLSVYDVAELGERFDLVIFMGVLYHLRHPLLALDLLREHVVSDAMLFQTMVRGSDRPAEVEDDYPYDETELFERQEAPRLHFIEGSLAGDPTNWWIPNRACAEAMLRSAGFTIEAHPEDEIYLCRADRDAQLWAR